MVDLFIDRVLLKNNTDQDELDTEREIVARLQNRILLLFFGCVTSESCQLFAPKLASFFKQLTDEAYVDRSAQLVLLYIRYRTHSLALLCRKPEEPILKPSLIFYPSAWTRLRNS